MNKLLKTVLATGLVLATVSNVFAYERDSFNNSYSRGNMMSYMSEDEYNEMKEYMEERFGGSMMDDYSYDEMVESMDRGFGNGRGFGRGRGCFGSNR